MSTTTTMRGPHAPALPAPATVFTAAAPIRDGFGKAMMELGKTDPRVVGLSADLTASIRLNGFAEAYPERFFQMGISEMDMVGTASGLALAGYVPFLTTFSVFASSLANQPIRLSAAYNFANVKVAVSHGGITVGPDGATHQAFEDIALMRMIPDLVVLVPGDANEAYEATLAAAAYHGPVYIRMGRGASDLMPGRTEALAIGRAYELRRGSDVAIFACGPSTELAIKAADRLAAEGIGVSVVNVPSIKPLDRDTILNVARRCGTCVTVEEHSVLGGLGGAISELLCAELPLPLERVGVHDTFGESGEPDEILARYGLTTEAVVDAARRAFDRRR